MDRLPTHLGGFLNRLRRKFRYRDVIQEIRTGGLEVDHLRTDGRVGGLVGRLGYDHRCGLRTEALLETDEVVPPKIIILVERADPRVLIIAQDVSRIESAFSPVI